MMVGDDQPVAAHERARAAVVEAHGGLHEVVEPRVVELKAVGSLELFAGWGGKEPHALVRPGGRDEGNDEDCQGTRGKFHI